MDRRELREISELRLGVMWDRMREQVPRWALYRHFFAPERGRLDEADYDVRMPLPKRMIDEFKMIAENFAAGMQSGLASPSRKWFSLAAARSMGETSEDVKSHISLIEQITAERLLASNFYDQIHDLMLEQGVFGIGAMFIESDPDEIFYCRTLTAGEYAIEQDHLGRVNRFARKIKYNLMQLASDFGAANLPETVRDKLADWRHHADSEIYTVCNLIQKNAGYERDAPAPDGMEYQSLWWIEGIDEPEFIRVGGYREFPVIVGRWQSISSALYTHVHPAAMSLHDAMTAQDIERDARGALEREVRPAMLASSAFIGSFDPRPGAVNFFNAAGGQVPHVQRLYNFNFDFNSAFGAIERKLTAIKSTWRIDMFQLWAQNMNSGRTATEIDAREAEKAYILGPLTIRQCALMLNLALSRVGAILARAGFYPIPPDGFDERSMRLEYTNEFAQIQKRASLGGMQTVMQTVQGLAQIQAAVGAPEVADMIDYDEFVEAIGDMYPIPAGVILGDDRVAELREKRAGAEAEAKQIAQMESAAKMAPQMASAARDMSQAVPDEQGRDALSVMAQTAAGGAI